MQKARRYVYEVSTILEGEYAKHLNNNMDATFIQPGGEETFHRAKQLVSNLITKDTGSKEIQHLKYLLGGEQSEAWRFTQRIFLEQILEGGFTREGKEALSEQARGIETSPGTTTTQHAPTGISAQLNKYRRIFSDQPDQLLRDVLGEQATSALHDINRVLRGLEQLYKITNGSQTAPWLNSAVNNLSSGERFGNALLTLGNMLMGVGWMADHNMASFGGAAAGTMGVAHFIKKVFGKDAATRFVEDFEKYRGYDEEMINNVITTAFVREYFRQLRQQPATKIQARVAEEQEQEDNPDVPGPLQYGAEKLDEFTNWLFKTK